MQCEKNQSPTPYVPYGHIGLEVTANGQTTTTPIPLPAKGFAAALPDGTKDTLAIDSAGRVEWVNATNEAVFDGSEAWGYVTTNTFYSNDKVSNGKMPTHDGYNSLSSRFANKPTLPNVSALSHGEFVFSSSRISANPSIVVKNTDVSTVADFKAWVTSNPFTVLYPIATPTTESLGYIDLPELPAGATVSIPELEAIGVSWFVPGASEIAEHAANVANRLREELAETEEAIADLATRVAVLES